MNYIYFFTKKNINKLMFSILIKHDHLMIITYLMINFLNRRKLFMNELIMVNQINH